MRVLKILRANLSGFRQKSYVRRFGTSPSWANLAFGADEFWDEFVDASKFLHICLQGERIEKGQDDPNPAPNPLRSAKGEHNKDASGRLGDLWDLRGVSGPFLEALLPTRQKVSERLEMTLRLRFYYSCIQVLELRWAKTRDGCHGESVPENAILAIRITSVPWRSHLPLHSNTDKLQNVLQGGPSPQSVYFKHCAH